MSTVQPSAAPTVAPAGEPPRFVVLDTNVLIRLLILDFGVKEKVDLSYFLSKAGASLILAHCQEDEFWRNAPRLWTEHVEKWQGVSADIKRAFNQVIDGLAAAEKLAMLTPEQLDAVAGIRQLKRPIEEVHAATYEWEAFESFAEKAIAEIHRAIPLGLVDTAEVERAAARRIEVGNPPRADGKARHWGDCVIWETILRLAARQEGPVWFATTDGDYLLANKNALHPFLEREVSAAGGTVKLFREAATLGFEFRTQFRLLKEAAQFVPEREATSMRNFLEGISSVSPEASWRDVTRALKALSYREREILKLRLGLGDGYRYLQQEVAEIFRLSRPRISDIEAEARRKFFKTMRDGEHASDGLDALETESLPQGMPAAH